VRVVVAPDKFAGTLTALEAAEAVQAGWHDVAASDEVVLAPMADGGPGFLAALATVGRTPPQVVPVTGPHGEPVLAQILVVEDAVRSAFVEAGQACGLHLSPHPPQPLAASTAGVVQLLEAALASGAGRVVVGVGGTASTDGGRPVAEAFDGRWPPEVELVVATDVESPLLGPAGAAQSFAPQKGASDREVEALEHRLTAWASSGTVDPSTPGAGAGGGLAYGLLRIGGRRVSGAALVAEAVGLPAAVRASDLVITGEGRLDFSSLRGKVVAEVARTAQASARPCVALVGSCHVGRREAGAAGIDEIHALADRFGPEHAMEQAADSLRALARLVAGAWRPA
jgi:glycerate kinase